MIHKYNAAGMLSESLSSEGFLDEYIYNNLGALTSVNFKDMNGRLYEKFYVTTDTQKRITKIKTINGFECNYEYGGPNGIFSKSTIFYDGVLADMTEVESYEGFEKKPFTIAIKGHLFDPSLFTQEMIFYPPLNNGTGDNYLMKKVKYSTQLDENWEKPISSPRVYYHFEYTRKFNENNFATERVGTDLLTNETYKFDYKYSICK